MDSTEAGTWIETTGQHQLKAADGRVLARISGAPGLWYVILHGPKIWEVARGEEASLAQAKRHVIRALRARGWMEQAG